MVKIPKKVSERFLRAVPRFQQVVRMARDKDVNESDTVAILSDMLSEIFGFDKYSEVTREFAIRGTYCDLATRVDDKVQFILEAKTVGIDLKDNHIRQAVDYGANNGVPWVVLTNAQEWRIYRIRFEQPISFDLVCLFDFDTLDARNDKDQDCLFLLSKEGLSRSAQEVYFEKVQSVNRHVIGALILSDPVLADITRELRKLSDGMKIESADVESIILKEVLKRDILEGDQAEEAMSRVDKFYRKSAHRKKKNRSEIESADTGTVQQDASSASQSIHDNEDSAKGDQPPPVEVE